MPSAAITSAMHSLVSREALGGPVLQRLGARLLARSAAVTAANVSGGKVDVSGRPPASEITSGRAVTAIRSRIAEDVITRVRDANRPA